MLLVGSGSLSGSCPYRYRVVLIMGILFPLSHLFGEEKEQEPIGKLDERVSAPASKDAMAYGKAERMRMKEFMNLERFISLPSERLVQYSSNNRANRKDDSGRKGSPAQGTASVSSAASRNATRDFEELRFHAHCRETVHASALAPDDARRPYSGEEENGIHDGGRAPGLLPVNVVGPEFRPARQWRTGNSGQGPESEQAPASQSSAQGQESTPSQKLPDPKD